jgi:hypothetical protein
VLWAGPQCALSHTTAAVIWGLGVAPLGRPELVVPRSRAPRAVGVVVHRVRDFGAGDAAAVARLPVTTPVRTVVDLAGVLGAADLEAALGRALTLGLVTVGTLRCRLDELGTIGRPGAARLRGLLAAIGSDGADASARMAG